MKLNIPVIQMSFRLSSHYSFRWLMMLNAYENVCKITNNNPKSCIFALSRWMHSGFSP